jgi:hypothetical protein
MIALLLAAQLSADIARGPAAGIPAPKSDLIRTLPKAQACFGGAGRMEVSLAQPTALYRSGDRPAAPLRKWVDYPEAQHCLVGGAP